MIVDIGIVVRLCAEILGKLLEIAIKGTLRRFYDVVDCSIGLSEASSFALITNQWQQHVQVLLQTIDVAGE